VTDAKQLIAKLESKGLFVGLAESLTGGALCSELVSVPGASKVVLGSIVAYQTELKSSALGVSAELLSAVGAVDAQVAVQMAEGIRSRLALQLLKNTDDVIGVSTTGVAGPDEQDGKPVGLVFISVVGRKGIQVWEERFSGDRQAIRKQTVDKAIERIWEYLG
jgi:nicotinamide-nucleotide amidase